MKRSIWVIDEGSPGHLAQSLGLAEALNARIPSAIHQLTYHFRAPGWIRNTGRSLAKRGWLSPKESWLRRLGHWTPDPFPDAPAPELLISSGGKSVLFASALARRFRAPLVYVGERKPYPADWFHTYFTPSDLERDTNGVLIDQVPTRLSPEDARAAARVEDWLHPGLWAMIVGGPSRSHRYHPQDWHALAQNMTALSQAHGIQWLLTTSRRTPKAIETQLRETLDPKALYYGIWWNQRPEKKMAALLGAAEKAFVTQDSVTMVTEAIGSGTPTIALIPSAVRFPRDSFLPNYLERLQHRGYLGRASIERRDQWVAATPPTPPQESPAQDMASRLISRLGWTSPSARAQNPQ